jgi:hypothetical protein
LTSSWSTFPKPVLFVLSSSWEDLLRGHMVGREVYRSTQYNILKKSKGAPQCRFN